MHIRNLSLVVFLLFTLVVLGQKVLTQSAFMSLQTPYLLLPKEARVDSINRIYKVDYSKVDSLVVEFGIFVPSRLLNNDWAITLSPKVLSTYHEDILPPITFKGDVFRIKQDDQYQKYNTFIQSIVDSTRYEEHYTDIEKKRHEISTRHDMYWGFFYDEWENQIQYEIWKGKQVGNVRSFTPKVQKSYKDQLLKQYELRITNQTKRYLETSMDTTGITKKYMDEYHNHIKKLPRFYVDESYISTNNVPKKFKYIYDNKRTLDDITNLMLDLVAKRDSALMAVPIYDYNKIVENEKRSRIQNDVFLTMVTLPKSDNLIVDSVIPDITRDIEILYKHKLNKSRILESDTLEIRLDFTLQALDGSSYKRDAMKSVFLVVNQTDSIKTKKHPVFLYPKEKFKGKDLKHKKVKDNKGNALTISSYNANLLEETPYSFQSKTIQNQTFDGMK